MSAEGMYHQIEDGADTRPILAGDERWVGTGCAYLRAVGIVHGFFVHDLALILLHAWNVSAPVNRTEITTGAGERVAPEV